MHPWRRRRKCPALLQTLSGSSPIPSPFASNFQRLTLRTGGVSAAVAYSYFHLLQQGILPLHESEMEREIPELAPLRGRDLPTLVMHDQRSYYDCMEKLAENIKTSGMICNTFEELEHSALSKSHLRFQIPHFPIGPFHLQLKPKTTAPPPHGWPSVIAWLDQQPPRSVLYVSFGTLVDINITSFMEMAWGLCESEVSFIWVIRPGLVQGREGEEAPPYPQGFEEKVGDRGRLVKWAVQVEVLSHFAIGGFWTHNGWNSTLESISAGVPRCACPGVLIRWSIPGLSAIVGRLECRLRKGSTGRRSRRLLYR